MSDQWDSYICNVNDKLASIFLDLGIRTSVPDPIRPWLLWAFVPFKHPRPDGLSSQQEFQTLIAIEDVLNASVLSACGAILSGRITSDGRREFYYYGTQPEGFEDAVAKCMATFQGYSADCGEQFDPEWRQYLDVLYPSDDDLERIKNRNLVDRQIELGDHPDIPREVDHFLYFENEAGRDDFANSVLAEGYRIVSKSQTERGDRRYAINVAKVQTTQLEMIDKTVLALCKLARLHGGEYDGWGCVVETGTENISKKPS